MENTVEISCEKINSEEITIGNISPFKIYEDKYCSKCEDYSGCLGLIDSTTMEIQESKGITGDKAVRILDFLKSVVYWGIPRDSKNNRIKESVI